MEYETLFVAVNAEGQVNRGKPTIEQLNLDGWHIVGVIDSVPRGMADMTDFVTPVATLVLERIKPEEFIPEGERQRRS